MATFVKRDSGWLVRVRKGGVSRSSTFRTKAEATAWALAVESDISAGKVGQIPNKTFGELLIRYSDEVAEKKRGARWEVARLGLIRRDLVLCDVRLPDLGPEHFAAWRDRRLAGTVDQAPVSAASVLREWHILSHACNVAIKEWRWLLVNPMQQVKKPAQPKARARRISGDEIERLLLACGYDYAAAPETAQARVGAALLFAIETAMRAGEIVNLTWSHVYLDRRVAHLPLTKNGHARDVPLSREALRLLDQLALIREGDSVFQIASPILDALFRKAKARALIEDLHFHDSRREALSRMARKVGVLDLAKISGHRDLRILQNTYYAPDAADLADLLD